ncbi:hypothetical protein [Andreprevotia chitinilytica]|uniref:hypothetical protein n=1 Tax=Andreprevotia chitinilytica TaxID=396808 RepID=UPI0012EBB46D|nr:hypothetical protein [Andreprevotia chitinilytica]
MYDCLDSLETRQPARLRTPEHCPRNRRWLRFSGPSDTTSHAERHLCALGFALERLADGSLLIFDLSVHTALALQQDWPTLIGHYETPPLCHTPSRATPSNTI